MTTKQVRQALAAMGGQLRHLKSQAPGRYEWKDSFFYTHG